jgi:nitrogen fixation protein NifX
MILFFILITMKIAITSSDGKHIDTKFGKAEKVYVFGVIDKEIRFIEKRETHRYYSPRPKNSFRKEAFENAYEAVKDCSILYTQKIGDIAAQRFTTLGIKVKQAEGSIMEVLGK